MRRIHIVYECKNDPNDPHSTISAYTKAFISKEKMLQYIDEQYKSIIQQWEDIGVTNIEHIYNEEDQYVVYAKDKDNNTLYYEIAYEGNIPVVFNYENDWEILNKREKLPIRDLPDKVYIVNQDMGVPGGCLADLPDSAYINIEDAYRRIDVLFDNALECWQDVNNIHVIKDLPEDKSLEGDEHYYFRTYIKEYIDVVK